MRRRRLLAALLLGATLTLPVAAAPVTLNLKDADINALVESMSVLTGRNFIVDPRVKARVTLISSRPMDEKELYEVFLSVLAVHGFAAVPSGKVIKIIPAAGAKQENIPTVEQLRGDHLGQGNIELYLRQTAGTARARPGLGMASIQGNTQRRTGRLHRTGQPPDQHQHNAGRPAILQHGGH